MKKIEDNKKIYLFLLLITVLGLLLRIWNLGKNPTGFFGDEASIGYNAYSILTTGKDEWGQSFPLLFKAFGEYKNPVMIYTAIPFIKLLGLSEFSVRLTSVFYGTLAIVSLFLVTSELLNKKVGLYAALFLAISPWHVHFSRVSFELISSTFWIPISLYLFLKSLKNFTIYYPLTIISSFIAFFTYYTAKIYLPLLLIAAFFIYFKETKHWFNKRLFWLASIIAVYLFLLVSLPYLKDNLFLSRWYEVKSNSLTTGYLIKGYLNHFSYDFLFKKGDIDFPGQFITRHSVRGLGELYLFQLPLILLAVALLIKYKKFRPLIFILFFVLIYPLGTIFTDVKPQATRSIIGVIPFQILTGYAVYALTIFIKKEKYKLLYVAALSIIIILSFKNYFFLLQDYPLYSSDYWGWQYGPREIIDYFKLQTKNYDELYMAGSFNASEIFLKFYDPERACKNCFIGGFDVYNPNRKQLFAVRVEDFNNLAFKFDLKKIIYYPNGRPAFYIIEPIS